MRWAACSFQAPSASRTAYHPANRCDAPDRSVARTSTGTVTIAPSAAGIAGPGVPITTYRSETYASLAKLVLEPDKSVLRLATLEPTEETKRRLYLKVPSDTPVALYFFYTSQTGSWKMILPPRLPWSVTVPLGRKGVDVETVRECRLGR